MSHIFPRHTKSLPPMVSHGEGAYLYDCDGKAYLDGSGGAAVSCLGHSDSKVVAAMQAQLGQVAFAHTGFFTSEPAERLADRLISLAPEGLDRVYVVAGGSEAMESALKLARQYYLEKGEPKRRHIIARRQSYHGNTLGALATGGNAMRRAQFQPILPETHHVSPVYAYRDQQAGESPEAYAARLADELEAKIVALGADQVMAFVAEPVVGATLGAVPPVADYFQRVREICDRYDVLLVADEVITGFGRIGSMFASTHYGFQPDMITCAKGMTSGYSPIGATIVSDRLYEPFRHGTTAFYHGYTFGGHPVSAAVALENLAIFEEEKLVENVRENSPVFRQTLEKLLDLPLVGDVRGDGYFFGIELVKDKATRETFNDAESERLLRGFLSKALFEAGLYCRADDRGDPVIQLAPPLTIGPAEFDEIEQILRSVLTEATSHL